VHTFKQIVPLIYSYSVLDISS